MYISSTKLILAKKADVNEAGLTTQSRYFEWYNMEKELHMRQHYTLDFDVRREGTMNSLTCFIYVDFGLPNTRKRRYICDNFPYNDDRLEAESQSIAFSTNKADTQCAGNWRNPIIILKQPRKVMVGDKIRVYTTTKTDTITPSYTFEVEVINGKDDQFHQKEKITILFDDLHANYHASPHTPTGKTTQPKPKTRTAHTDIPEKTTPANEAPTTTTNVRHRLAHLERPNHRTRLPFRIPTMREVGNLPKVSTVNLFYRQKEQKNKRKDSGNAQPNNLDTKRTNWDRDNGRQTGETNHLGNSDQRTIPPPDPEGQAGEPSASVWDGARPPSPAPTCNPPRGRTAVATTLLPETRACPEGRRAGLSASLGGNEPPKRASLVPDGMPSETRSPRGTVSNGTNRPTGLPCLMHGWQRRTDGPPRTTCDDPTNATGLHQPDSLPANEQSIPLPTAAKQTPGHAKQVSTGSPNNMVKSHQIKHANNPTSLNGETNTVPLVLLRQIKKQPAQRRATVSKQKTVKVTTHDSHTSKSKTDKLESHRDAPENTNDKKQQKRLCQNQPSPPLGPERCITCTGPPPVKGQPTSSTQPLGMCDNCHQYMRKIGLSPEIMILTHAKQPLKELTCALCARKTSCMLTEGACNKCELLAHEMNMTIDQLKEVQEPRAERYTYRPGAPEPPKNPPKAPWGKAEIDEPHDLGRPSGATATGRAIPIHRQTKQAMSQTTHFRTRVEHRIPAPQKISDDTQPDPHRGQRDTAKRIEEGKEMSEEDFCNIFAVLKESHKEQAGLDDPAFQRPHLPTQRDKQRADLTWENRRQGPTSTQALYLGGNHWVAAHGPTQMGVEIFDTLPSASNHPRITELAELCFGTNQVQIHTNTQRQVGTLDCGPLTVARIVDIMHGTLDASRQHDQAQTRHHLAECLKQTPPKITPFPTTPTEKRTKRTSPHSPTTNEQSAQSNTNTKRKRHHATYTTRRQKARTDRNSRKRASQGEKFQRVGKDLTDPITGIIQLSKGITHNVHLSDAIRQHLHTRQTVGTDAHVVQDTLQGPWNTNDHLRTKFGAKREDNACFMANAYSLINLASNTTEELTHLSEAREALSKSTMPTRIVLLGQHGNGELPPEDRMKLIMTIRKETINLTHATATTSQQTPNNKNIHIYMGEANGPLNYDAQDLKQAIQTATGAHITTPSHAGTQREERSIRSHNRHPPHTKPKYQWYRTTLPKQPPEDKHKEAGPQTGKRKQHPTAIEQYPGQALEEHNAILGAMGILPLHFRHSMANIGIQQDNLDTNTITQIRKITHDTMLSVYLRTEQWKKRKK